MRCYAFMDRLPRFEAAGSQTHEFPECWCGSFITSACYKCWLKGDSGSFLGSRRLSLATICPAQITSRITVKHVLGIFYSSCGTFPNVYFTAFKSPVRVVGPGIRRKYKEDKNRITQRAPALCVFAFCKRSLTKYKNKTYCKA